MNINRLVLDLSHHETVQSYDQVKADGIAGIIYKATQGTSYHDATYWKERKKAMDAGLLWGSYHFGDHSSVENQVRNYLEYTTVFKDELFCLDLEPNDDNSMTLNQAREWIIAVEAALNRAGQCVIYSGSTIKEMLGEQKDEFWGSRRLWLAQYGTTPVVQASWDTYWLWQYSDGENGPEPHDVNGIKDHVDSNSFDGTADELEAQWASGAVSPLPPTELPLVQISIVVPAGVRVEVTKTQT